MRRAVIVSPVLGLTAALLAGCPDRTISEVNPEQGRVEYKDIPVTVNRNLDLLFVIDDSPSMADKQQNLADNFPNFINVLNTIPGGLPDVHIGVVTSDMGSKGVEDAQPGNGIGMIGNGGCSGTGKAGNLQVSGAASMITGNFVSDIKQSDGSRLRNYTGNLTDVFAAMAKVGAGGCGFEQHLYAMKAALDNNPANANFLRDDAYLGVIFIQDEDDCSFSHSTLISTDTGTLGPLQSFRCTRYGVLCDVNGKTTDTMNQVGSKDQCHPNDNSQYVEKVANFVTFLKGKKTDPTKVIVAGVAGVTTPFSVELRPPPGGTTAIPALAHSCTYQGSPTPGNPSGVEVADPATRLKFFLDQFPNRSTFTTVCQKDLSGGLQQIGDLLKSVIGDPCIEGTLADVDPTTPGDQYECSVSDVTNLGKPNQTETIIPECNASLSNKDCWHLVEDTVNCPNAQHLTLKIERNQAPPPETHVIANCVTVAK